MSRVVRTQLKPQLTAQYTAGGYLEASSTVMGHLDVLYTYFIRYPWLIEVDFDHEGGFGTPADWLAAHPAMAVIATLGAGVLALLHLRSNLEEEGAAKRARLSRYESSSKYIIEQLECQEETAQFDEPESVTQEFSRNESADSLDSDLSVVSQVSSLSSPLELYNQHLQRVLEQDQQLSSRYSRISLNAHYQLEFVLHESDQATLMERAKTLVNQSWITLSIASLAYWILWIGSGVITGNFGIGIEPLGGAGFAIPAAVAVVYPLLKLKKWLKTKFAKFEVTEDGITQIVKDPETLNQVAFDQAKLLQKSIYEVEKQRLKAQWLRLNPGEDYEAHTLDTNPSLTQDSITLTDIRYLGADKKQKALLTFIGSTISTFILTQYAAWILTDLLKVAGHLATSAAIFTPILGYVFMGLSVVKGAYEAYKRYQVIKAHEDKLVNLGRNENTLEVKHEQQLAALAKLETRMLKISSGALSVKLWLKDQENHYVRTQVEATLPEMKAPKSFKEKLKSLVSSAYVFISGGTTGAMLARMFTIAGTGACLPFVAVALANPYTVGIVVGLGLIYGAFKVYQHYQAKKETKARALLEARVEKVEALQEATTLCDLRLKVMVSKCRDLEAQYKDVSLPAPKAVDDLSYVRKPKQLNSFFKSVDDQDLIYSDYTATPSHDRKGVHRSP